MKRVESLGISCELGLIQRHCRAEPLGLYRFSRTPLPGLIDALNARFDGIDDPAELEFTLFGHLDEWVTNHRRYGFGAHTSHLAAKTSEEEIRKHICVHYRFLARKLTEDLQKGDSVFVYRPEAPMPAGEDTYRLLEAMRKFGPSVLMWMDVPAQPEKIGTVEWTIPGRLMTGYIDRFTTPRWAAGASFEVWLQVIAAAVKLKDEMRVKCAAASD